MSITVKTTELNIRISIYRTK